MSESLPPMEDLSLCESDPHILASLVVRIEDELQHYAGKEMPGGTLHRLACIFTRVSRRRNVADAQQPRLSPSQGNASALAADPTGCHRDRRRGSRR